MSFSDAYVYFVSARAFYDIDCFAPRLMVRADIDAERANLHLMVRHFQSQFCRCFSCALCAFSRVRAKDIDMCGVVCAKPFSISRAFLCPNFHWWLIYYVSALHYFQRWYIFDIFDRVFSLRMLVAAFSEIRLLRLWFTRAHAFIFNRYNVFHAFLFDMQRSVRRVRVSGKRYVLLFWCACDARRVMRGDEVRKQENQQNDKCKQYMWK